jgi:hypothetical protein
MAYLNFCEENAGPELGFDSRVCGRGQIMPNLCKGIKCVVPRGLCMRSSKEHDSGLEHHPRALGQN